MSTLLRIGPAPHADVGGTGACTFCPRPAVLAAWRSGAQGVVQACPPCFADDVAAELGAMPLDEVGALLGAAGIVIRYVSLDPDGSADLDAQGRVGVEAPSRGWTIGESGVYLPDARVASVEGWGWERPFGPSLAKAIANAADRAATRCITVAIAQTRTVWVARSHQRAQSEHAWLVVDKVSTGRDGEGARVWWLVVERDGQQRREIPGDFVVVAAPPAATP